MAAAGPVTRNVQQATIEQIIGSIGSIGKQSISAIGTAASSSLSTDAGSYTLNVVYYILLYLLFIFIILVIVHFTITPIFVFTPGAKGIIGVPGVPDGNKVYWNEKTQPPVGDSVPKPKDSLEAYPFTQNFSFSVDLLVRRVPQTSENGRVILFMTDKTLPQSLQTAPANNQSITTYFGTGTDNKASMVMYLNETNDLLVSFYTSDDTTNGFWYSSRPIKNIPLYTPFRIGVIVEEKVFTLYLNNQQVFQRFVPKPLGTIRTGPQRFYSAPEWSQQPVRTAFVQNLIVWNRVIQYSELKASQPALAAIEDFDAPEEPGSGSCS